MVTWSFIWAIFGNNLFCFIFICLLLLSKVKPISKSKHCFLLLHISNLELFQFDESVLVGETCAIRHVIIVDVIEEIHFGGLARHRYEIAVIGDLLRVQMLELAQYGVLDDAHRQILDTCALLVSRQTWQRNLRKFLLVHRVPAIGDELWLLFFVWFLPTAAAPYFGLLLCGRCWCGLWSWRKWCWHRATTSSGASSCFSFHGDARARRWVFALLFF